MPENNTQNGKPEKVRFQLWMAPSTQELADKMWKEDHCSCKGDFIEKAILFYCGYLQSEKNQNYLPNIVVSTLKSIVRDSENRQNRNLYKIAVELNVLARVIATIKGTTEINYESIRGQSHADVRKCNGVIAVEDVVDWQNS